MNFPINPTLNQTYTYGGKTWKWDGTAWNLQAAGVAQATVAFTGSFTDLINKPTTLSGYGITDGYTIPTQTGNTGKYLTTNGTVTSWATIDALPSQTGNTGKYLTTNGTVASWATITGGGSPGGSTTQIQYNNAGAFAGSSNFVWDNTNNILGIGATSGASRLTISNGTDSATPIVYIAGYGGNMAQNNTAVLKISANMNTTNVASLLWLEHNNPAGSTSSDYAFRMTGNLYGAAREIFHIRSDTGATYINPRNDIALMYFQQSNTTQGTISVSGTTVSYNSFAGSHWSQWLEGRGHTPTILPGTVLSTIDEMCVWKSKTWVDYSDGRDDQIIETTEIGSSTESLSTKGGIERSEFYIGDAAVGTTIIENGVSKIITDDGNERLPKVKISDVVGDRRVYGVFMDYDEAQDIHVTAVGAYFVRIASGVTVTAGDLLESNGDGCARVQSDDLIKSSTIGKVTTNIKIAEYDDGSYTVPCVLFCG